MHQRPIPSLALAVTALTGLAGCITDIDVDGAGGGESDTKSALEVLQPDDGDGLPQDGEGTTGDDGGGAGDGTGDGAGTGDCGAEICGGGGDGDGEPREEDCRADFPNCNGFMGHAEPECWQDNRGGCSDEVLDAWCTRRTTGEVWDGLHQEWVDARCDGEVILDDNTFSCADSSGEVLYTCTTPLVLAFARQPVRTIVDDGQTTFELAPAGRAPQQRTDWPTADTPWLALDRDGDGRITSGAELFGSATMTARGPAAHGFAALQELDDNADGLVDARDAAFTRLVLWRDVDGDRVSAAAELSPLSASGVVALGVAFSVSPRCDERGNCERERGAFTFVDGGVMKRGDIVDLHLVARDAATVATTLGR